MERLGHAVRHAPGGFSLSATVTGARWPDRQYLAWFSIGSFIATRPGQLQRRAEPEFWLRAKYALHARAGVFDDASGLWSNEALHQDVPLPPSTFRAHRRPIGTNPGAQAVVDGESFRTMPLPRRKWERYAFDSPNG
jgi:hypothetical protein